MRTVSRVLYLFGITKDSSCVVTVKFLMEAWLHRSYERNVRCY